MEMAICSAIWLRETMVQFRAANRGDAQLGEFALGRRAVETHKL